MGSFTDCMVHPLTEVAQWCHEVAQWCHEVAQWCHEVAQRCHEVARLAGTIIKELS